MMQRNVNVRIVIARNINGMVMMMEDKILLILDKLREHSWHGECCHDCSDIVNELVKLVKEQIKEFGALYDLKGSDGGDIIILPKKEWNELMEKQ